jgi:hypothetical protein
MFTGSLQDASRHRKEFLFVSQSLTSDSRSRKGIKLQDAARRAHAARQPRPERRAFSPLHFIKTKSHPDHRRHDRKAPKIDDEKAPSSNWSRPATILYNNRRQPHMRMIPLHQPWGNPPGPADSTLLGQGSTDPFHTGPVQVLPSIVYDILDYGGSPS